MKKILVILTLFMLSMSSFSFGWFKSNKPKNYSLEATIRTNKGDINVFLYPEAAPLAVLNFVNLSRRGFYNGLTFHRVLPNTLVQGGDPNGDGTGGPGYTFDDEIAKWLNFDDPGMLAMANSGPDTNGSQFFITINPLDQLNGKYTIFGELKTRADLSFLKTIRQGDVINSIEIRGKDYEEFLMLYATQLDEWNAALNAKFRQ